MADNQWYDRRMVINDLSRVSGGRNCKGSISTLVTDRPPSRRSSKDDFESPVDFDCLTGNNDDIDPSAFKYIPQMLNMIEDFYDNDFLSDNEIVQDNERNEDILLISRLNPDIQEFKPIKETECNRNRLMVKNGKEVIKSRIGVFKNVVKVGNHESQLCNGEGAKNITEVPASANHHDHVGSEMEDNANIKKVTKEVSTIPAPRKKCCRNVALSRFLNQDNPITVSMPSKVETPILLMKPDNFMKSVACNDVKASTSNEFPTEELDEEELSTIKDSVDKVNDWLNNRDQMVNSDAIVNRPTVSKYISGEPIKFKPKCILPAKEQIRNKSSTVSVSPVNNNIIKKFEPSKQSEKLYSKYLQQNVATNTSTEDMWSRVQRQMREKDEKIRQGKH